MRYYAFALAASLALPTPAAAYTHSAWEIMPEPLPFAEDSGSVTPNHVRIQLLKAGLNCLYDWLIHKQPDDCPELSKQWIVTGRIMYGRRWHFISTGPQDFRSALVVLDGLHGDLGHTPHQLGLSSLSSAMEILGSQPR